MSRERRVWDADSIEVNKFLPNVGDAVVAKSKIVDYLLSTTHLEGRDKANFFLRFGFSSEHWEKFADALKLLAASHEVTKTIATISDLGYAIK